MQVLGSVAERRGALSVEQGDLHIEPAPLRPGEPFTITLFLHSNVAQPVDRARFDLEVTGPTGYYRFEVKVKGPLPAEGVSMVQVRPEHLARLEPGKVPDRAGRGLWLAGRIRPASAALQPGGRFDAVSRLGILLAR